MSINPSTPEPLNRCVRIKRDGERCKRLANNGTTVCNSHGARAPQIRAKAQTRLLMSADKLMGALLKIALNEKVPVQHRLVAIRDGLDRANFGAKTTIELDIATGPKANTFESFVAEAYIDVEETDEGDDYITYADGTNRVRQIARDEDIVDADVVDDDEPPVQTRHDRAAFAEVERSTRRDARPPKRGAMSPAERKRREAEAMAALERAAPPESSRRVDRMTHEQILLAREAGTNLSSRGDAMRDAVEADLAAGKRRTRNTEGDFG